MANDPRPNDPLHTRDAHVLALQGIENFRDIGGYPAADGRSLKWRRVFRCGHLMQMTAADGATLEPLAITAIFDLRTPAERRSFPTAWQCSTQPQIFTIDVHADDADPKADLFQQIVEGSVSRADVHAYMLTDYARIVWQMIHGQTIRCTHVMPMCWHCRALRIFATSAVTLRPMAAV